MEEILYGKKRRDYTLFRLLGITIVMFLIFANTAGAATFAYITNAGDNTTSVIDTATNTVISTINVGNMPFGIAVTPDGSKVYVANNDSNNVSVINTTTYNITASIDVGIGAWGVAVTPDGSKIYVTNSGDNTVSVIDIASDTVIATIPVGVGPAGVAVNPDGSKAYVANSEYRENETFNSTVSVIDTVTNTVIANVVVGSGPLSVVFTPDGTKAYVTNAADNTISVINTADNTVMATINVGSWPIGIAVTPDGSKIYVANSALFENSTLNGTLSVINTTTNTVTDTVPVGVNPHGVAITSDGSNVYVANAYEGTVSVINTTTDKVTTSIPVGLWPISIGQFIGGPVKTINSTIPTEIPPEIVSTEALAETPSEAYCPEIKDYVPEYTGGAVIHIMNAVKNDIIVSWAKTNTSKAIFQVNIPAGQTQTVKAPGGSYDEYIRMECSWYKVTPGPVVVKSGYEYSWKYYTVLKDNTVVYDGTGFKPIPDSQAPKI